MRFPLYFQRRKGGSGNVPVLGTADTKPTFTSSKLDYTKGGTSPSAPGDNILAHKLQRPMERVAIGWWYEGVGAAPASLPVTIYAWDDTSGHWYEAATGTLANGKLTYLRCVSLADPPQVQANLGQPQHGVEVLVIVEDNAGADGTYHFVAGPDSAFF